MKDSTQSGYKFPLTMLTALFFAWGFIICLNDILIPHLKSVFELNYLRAALVQFCFFFAFFLMSVPSGWVINRIGYQKSVVVGLLITGLGAFLFLPAASVPSYGWFLTALFVLATGITLLQVAANPYVALLGPPHLSSSRLNLAQAVNSLGTTIAPVLGGYLILRATGLDNAAGTALEQASAVKGPYLGITLALVALAILFYVIKLPKPIDAPTEKEPGLWREALGQPHLTRGAIAIFLYVGAEIAVGSFLVNFITQPHILGISAQEAAFYVSIYWGCAMVGRFIGSAVQTKVSPAATLTVAAVAAFALILGSVFTQGALAMGLLLAVGLFNSIMFPTIFTLGVNNLGRLTGIGSSILVMAIVGGAIIPVGMGALADRFSIQWALILPALCYVYIAHYAVRGSRVVSKTKEGVGQLRAGLATGVAVAGGLALALTLFMGASRAEAGEVPQSHNEVVTKLWSKAQVHRVDLPHFMTLLDQTVESLTDRNPGLGPDYPIWVLPSPVYPETYTRDTFWALTGYGHADLLTMYVDMFSKNSQHAGWTPRLAGQIPTYIRKHEPNPETARRIDESTMLWVIAAKMAGKTVASEPYLYEAYRFLHELGSVNGAMMVAHGWIDAWEPVHTPVLSANNQGEYAVALRALKDMGVAVPDDEIADAVALYRGLAGPQGYLQAYQGRDVIEVSSLLGEALSLYLWNESMLDKSTVLATVGKFTPVNYRDGQFLGFKCLANPDGSYLDFNEFWEIAERDPGNYQNGASWILYEELAMYAAARHSTPGQDDLFLDRFVLRIKSETRYEDSSKEFICTGGTCGSCDRTSCYCPDGICGVGGFRYNRSRYGWNAFIKLLLTRH